MFIGSPLFFQELRFGCHPLVSLSRSTIFGKPFPEPLTERMADITQNQTKLSEIREKYNSKACSHCAKAKGDLKRCSGCKVAKYCSHECQKRDWMAKHNC